MLRYVGMFDFLLNEKYIWRNAYNVQSAQQRRLTLIKCIRRRHLSGIHCIFSSGPISNTHPPPKNNRPHKFEGTTTVATAAATAAVSKYFFSVPSFLPFFIHNHHMKKPAGLNFPSFPPFPSLVCEYWSLRLTLFKVLSSLPLRPLFHTGWGRKLYRVWRWSGPFTTIQNSTTSIR